MKERETERARKTGETPGKSCLSWLHATLISFRYRRRKWRCGTIDTDFSGLTQPIWRRSYVAMNKLAEHSPRRHNATVTTADILLGIGCDWTEFRCRRPERKSLSITATAQRGAALTFICVSLPPLFHPSEFAPRFIPPTGFSSFTTTFRRRWFRWFCVAPDFFEIWEGTVEEIVERSCWREKIVKFDDYLKLCTGIPIEVVKHVQWSCVVRVLNTLTTAVEVEQIS